MVRVHPSKSSEKDDYGPREETRHLSKIEAIFVLAFDIKKGNIVEWTYPEGYDCDGIEWKAIVSGMHEVDEDFVYFRHKGLSGLSCFNCLRTGVQSERGARMRAVGVLMTRHDDLHPCYETLTEQAHVRNNNPEADYQPLIAYYHQYNQEDKVVRSSPLRDALMSSVAQATLHGDNSALRHGYPGSFASFFKYFGPKVFMLWKAALLHKRILFFSTVPIGVTCEFVHCTEQLAFRFESLPSPLSPQNVLFCVSLADFDTLNQLDSYIACTSDRIYHDKGTVRDVYVDRQQIDLGSVDNGVIKVTKRDKQTFRRLYNNYLKVSAHGWDVDMERAEYNLRRHFYEANNHLLGMIQRLQNGVCVTIEDIDAMGLDPHADQPFLLALAESLDVNITAQTQRFLCC